MPRIASINIPDNKQIYIALTYVYGIGIATSKKICKECGVDISIKAKDLNNQQLDKIREYIDQHIKTEGDLKLVINQNVKRLKEIGTYRGLRHIRRLPSRGQRTKTNARTKRGKKICVGSGRKPAAEKT